MTVKRSGSRVKSAPPYAAGDVYSFRTSPATEFSAQDTRRYASLKILGLKADLICFAVLDGVFDRHPELEEVVSLPLLTNTRFYYRGALACCCVPSHFENDLEDFRYVGTVELSSQDERLLNDCQNGGPWSGASTHAEGEWRWHHDRASYEDEV
jgi:hypothetical protein